MHLLTHDVRLRSVHDPPGDFLHHNETLARRLTDLLKQIGEDIEACANACDAYRKQSTLAKVVKSFPWDRKLASFVETFIARREHIHLAVSMHTLQGVGTLNMKVDAFTNTLDIW